MSPLIVYLKNSFNLYLSDYKINIHSIFENSEEWKENNRIP